VPTTPGDYHFTIAVVDSDVPQNQLQRELTIRVIAGLTLTWKDPPAVHGDAISGSAVITNQMGYDMVLTVVIVAVNQIGRATALGYQELTIPASGTSPVIPFSSSPGAGTYYVRADAVAHQAGRRRYYRASKTSEPMTLAAEF
jgi:hypothetical protein